MAAENTGRRSRGLELDPALCRCHPVPIIPDIERTSRRVLGALRNPSPAPRRRTANNGGAPLNQGWVLTVGAAMAMGEWVEYTGEMTRRWAAVTQRDSPMRWLLVVLAEGPSRYCIACPSGVPSSRSILFSSANRHQWRAKSCKRASRASASRVYAARSRHSNALARHSSGLADSVAASQHMERKATGSGFELSSRRIVLTAIIAASCGSVVTCLLRARSLLLGVSFGVGF
jgi:hypothetical protein